jgi:hypothetical protein
MPAAKRRTLYNNRLRRLAGFLESCRHFNTPSSSAQLPGRPAAVNVHQQAKHNWKSRAVRQGDL